MRTTVEDIFNQFNRLSEDHQVEFIMRLQNVQEQRSWKDMIDRLAAATISESEIQAEVEAVRSDRYQKTATLESSL